MVAEIWASVISSFVDQLVALMMKLYSKGLTYLLTSEHQYNTVFSCRLTQKMHVNVENCSIISMFERDKSQIKTAAHT